MKPRRQSDLGSLDSLLDTMTNVVGILVIILVVTILGVQEAVGRISEQLADQEPVSEEQYEQALTQADELAVQLQALRDKPDPQVDLSRERDQLASLQAAVKQLESQLDVKPQSLPDPAALTQQIAAQRKALMELTRQTEATRQRSEQLDQRLATTPIPKRKKPKQTTIPNPRTAPKGATPYFILCKGGRAIPVPLDRLMQLGEQRVKTVQRSSKGDTPPCKAVIDYFERLDVNTRGFRLKVRLARDRIILRFYPEDGLGETVEQMQGRASQLRRAVQTIKRSNHYVRYVVWPDSYEAYLSAREITDEAGLPAGWVPFGSQSVFERWTLMTCVPDKPLPPVAPKPPADPNAPKPLPEPPID